MIVRAIATILLLAAFARAHAASHTITDFGAKPDGSTSATAAVQKAIDAARQAGGGLVLVPPGKFLIGTIEMKSRVTLQLAAGATLLATTNLAEYRHPVPPANMPEAKWGKWHRGLIVAENAEDVAILGPGKIDGAKVFDPTGEERMRGPHTIVFLNCRRFTFRDLEMVDSANYAVFFMMSDDVEFRNCKFVGGWDGIHWRGAPDRWCKNVDIIDCQFYTGDDSIAGRYWDNTLITGCIINSSCNGIRLIGPARNLTISNNLFPGPGRRPHRTSRERNRTNMLSGIILQPGAWDATTGPLDDVFVTGNTMKNVASPITIWTKPGNTAGRITIDGLTATGVYRSALSVESWAEEPIGEVIFRNVSVEFAGGGTEDQAKTQVKGPGVDARPLPAWGLYTRNVERIKLHNVNLHLASDDARPAIFADKTKTLDRTALHLPEKSEIVQTNTPAAR